MWARRDPSGEVHVNFNTWVLNSDSAQCVRACVRVCVCVPAFKICSDGGLLNGQRHEGTDCGYFTTRACRVPG